jgi:hypothetical protein
VFGVATAGSTAGGVVVVARTALLDAPWNVKKPSGTPLASVPDGRPDSNASTTRSIGPTSSMAGAAVPMGRTSAQPHISVSVSPSSGAPAGWKSVARWKAEKGIRTYRQPLTSSLKLTSKRSAVSLAGSERLSKISAWYTRPVAAP